MMRNVLVALVFFFGPALLMLVLRSLVFLVRYRLERRRHEHFGGSEVIDITPLNEGRSPSRLFWVLALVLGVLSAMVAFNTLSRDNGQEIRRVYVPAHVNEQGEIVPGHWEPVP